MEHAPLMSPESINKRKAINQIIAVYRLRIPTLEALLQKHNLASASTSHLELTDTLLHETIEPDVFTALTTIAENHLNSLPDDQRIIALQNAIEFN